MTLFNSDGAVNMQAVADLSADFLQRAMLAAAGEGWRGAVAQHLAAEALELYLMARLNGAEDAQAFAPALQQAHFLMFEEMYDAALVQGLGHRNALLMVLTLDRELAENRGEPEVRYPQGWIDAAVAAVQAAAARQASLSDQIAAGFSALGAATRTS